MHPRSRLSPRLDNVFHVTKSGCSGTLLSSELSDVALEFALMPLGVELPGVELEELPDEGVDARRRVTAAGLWTRAAVSGSLVFASASSALLYLAQSVSTSWSERPDRFSRSAARLSKQYAQ